MSMKVTNEDLDIIKIRSGYKLGTSWQIGKGFKKLIQKHQISDFIAHKQYLLADSVNQRVGKGPHVTRRKLSKNPTEAKEFYGISQEILDNAAQIMCGTAGIKKPQINYGASHRTRRKEQGRSL